MGISLGLVGLGSFGSGFAELFKRHPLVDRIALFEGPDPIGAGGIAAPIDRHNIPAGFRPVRMDRFGPDAYLEWVRDI